MSRRVSTRLVRTSAVVTLNAATGEAVRSRRADIYAHVCRSGLRQQWLITAGKDGPVLTAGSRWLRENAFIAARAAAERRDLGRGAR